MADEPAPRRRRKRDDDLLRAATRVFWRRGYSAATIQEVAEEMGVLKGSLYYYIDSKEDLLFWVFDACHADASKIFRAVEDMDVPAIERLEIFIRSFVEFYLLNMERVGLYFRQWRYLTGERRETVVCQRREYDRFISGLLREARDAGEACLDLDEKYMAFFILGAVNGIMDWYSKEGLDKPPEIAAAYAKMTVSMIPTGPVTSFSSATGGVRSPT
jgi:TetR/AcrR family transcriptional regulator, cholesterol catabolism regulator